VVHAIMIVFDVHSNCVVLQVHTFINVFNIVFHKVIF